jgi:hypothetical protein
LALEGGTVARGAASSELARCGHSEIGLRRGAASREVGLHRLWTVRRENRIA